MLTNNDIQEIPDTTDEENYNTIQFKPDVLKSIVTSNFINTKTKISDDALSLLNEVLKILVIETSKRAIKQTQDEGLSTVTVNQVEAILHQIIHVYLTEINVCWIFLK